MTVPSASRFGLAKAVGGTQLLWGEILLKSWVSLGPELPPGGDAADMFLIWKFLRHLCVHILSAWFLSMEQAVGRETVFAHYMAN